MKMKNVFAGIAACAIATSALAVTAFAVPIANANSDDGDKYVYSVMDNLKGHDITDVYGARFTFSTFDPEVGAGGGFIWNSTSQKWNQVEWGNEGSDKPVMYSADDLTVTRLEDAPVFAATDEYAQVVIAQWDNWGEAITVESVVLLDADGNELEEVEGGEAEATTTTEEKKDTTTTTTKKPGGSTTTDNKKTESTKTGDAGVGVAVAALSLAGAAAFVARKKH